jgi:diguanylate cyclase (GGDEF)-like protein
MRTSALIDAYRKAAAVQFQPDPPDLGAALANADAHGWPDVEYMLHYAAYCHAATSALPQATRVKAAIEQMRRLSDRLGDTVIEAMTTAIEARVRGSALTTGEVVNLEQDEADLAHAIAELDDADQESPFRGIAYFACAVAYAQSAAVELEVDMYDRVDTADRYLPQAFREIGGITAREVAQNRVSALLDLACEQAELGHREAAARLAVLAIDRPLVRSTGAGGEAIQRQRAELMVLAALARRPPPATPPAMNTSHHPGVAALEHLAAAIRFADDGKSDAAADAALTAIDELEGEMIRTMHGYALSIAARRTPPQPIVERYIQALAEDRRHTRQRLIGAARARIQAESVRIENAKLTERAFSDELTGLGNRHALARHLATIARSVSHDVVAVMLVDIDEFKAINDAFGHLVGDEVLRRVGRLLDGHVRAGDVVVRLGGDEFVVVAHGAGTEQALTSAERLVQVASGEEWSEVANGLSVGISVGVSAGHAADVHRLIDAADQGLYRAKQSGRGRVASIE